MRTIISVVAAMAVSAVAIVVAPVTAAAEVVKKSCDGDQPGNQILRCVEMHYDAANRRYRPHAGILDRPGGADYDVDVYSVTVNGVTYYDPDGLFPDGDTATTELQRRGSGGSRLVTYSAVVRWRNAATGAWDSDGLPDLSWVC